MASVSPNLSPTTSPTLYSSSFRETIQAPRISKPFRQRYTPIWLREREKFWLNQPRSRSERAAHWIVYSGMLVGLLSAIVIIVINYLGSNRAEYVLIMHDDFSGTAISTQNWQHEQRVDGFVENSFDVTTDSSANSWVSRNMLHIKPTVGPIHAEGEELDLEAEGKCTSTIRSQCYVLQNTTAYSVIPNVQTARLRSKASITFGKAQVVAKLPRGDWIFSTIGLDPEELIYGQFPASGKIDIMQNRGNSDSFVSGGRNRVDTIVHFGADGHPISDCASLARNSFTLQQTDFSDKFHTFGIEWTPAFIRTWIDYPSNTFMEVRAPTGYWNKAAFATRYPNDATFSKFANPWTNGTLSAPYDKPFHLTLRANVGSITGIFAEDPSKPWFDDAGRGASMITMQHNQTWVAKWPSDEDRTMYIKDVKIWQQIM